MGSRVFMEVVPGLLRFTGTAFCIMQMVDVIKCAGPSMLPTLSHEGDLVLVDKLTPHFRAYERGEVVIAKSISNPRNTVCKRIVATEGDTVCVRPRYATSEVEFHRVPKGHVWLEGDNKLDSLDSREYGAVPAALIQSRVILRLWPLTKINRIKKETMPHAFREPDAKHA